MYFELTEALIHDILFSMEDQIGDFLLDTQEGIVINVELEFPDKINRDDSRYEDLPEWDSAKGFRLMERFTVSLKNPLIQHELTNALDQGKGVFRAFKNILNRYPEVEKRWFAFKEREMKREIIRWYNELRDEWGLKRIGTEPEETDNLILEDFIFRKPEAADMAVAEELHRRIFEDKTEHEKKLTGMMEAVKGDIALIAETSSGDFAAYIEVLRKGQTLYINALEVKPEFQGLGIGEELCSRLLDNINPDSISYIAGDLPIEAEGFSQVLLRNSFKPYATRYYLKLNNEL